LPAMKIMLLALTSILVGAPAMMGAKKPKPPGHVLTPEEAHIAYSVSVNHLMDVLKAPSTAHFQSFEESTITWNTHWLLRNQVQVEFLVDAQNSFGAMLRSRYACYVDVLKPLGNGRYRVLCNEYKR